MWVYLWVWTTVDDYSAMQWPCATGFHVPMKSEWEAINNAGISLWAWASSWWNNMKIYLKLPFAWFRLNTSPWNTVNQGTDWGYWFCSLSNNKSDGLYMNSSTISFNSNNYSCSWLCVRPIKDIPVAPDSNRTVLYQWTWAAWIYHNSTLWLISLSSDWTNWITIADKNLWATTVYNNGNTLSEANCGKYYQRWNNYGFAWTWNVTTSSTQVNAQNYWPWNYYSSSTYIVQSWEIRWDSSNNNDLRWWVTGVQQKTVYPELKNAYIGEYKEWNILSSTICYYPLKNNNTDFTWNTTINKSGTKQAIGYEFTWTNDWVRTSAYTNQSAFLSARLYIKTPTVWTSSSAPWWVGYLAKGKMRYNYIHQWTPDCIQFNYNSSTWQNTRVYGVNNQWFHLAFWYNWTEAYYYKNWVKTIIQSTTSLVVASQNDVLILWADAASYDIILSDFIVDWVDRESEIVNYYNQTKSNYWL